MRKAPDAEMMFIGGGAGMGRICGRIFSICLKRLRLIAEFLSGMVRGRDRRFFYQEDFETMARGSPISRSTLRFLPRLKDNWTN